MRLGPHPPAGKRCQQSRRTCLSGWARSVRDVVRAATMPPPGRIAALHHALSGAQSIRNAMADESRTEYFIQGVTTNGKRFRPSDWSERLCGVMSCFGPGAHGPNARLKYSLYVRPVMLGDIKCVVVDERLKDLEPMAFNFVMNFAKDNGLVVTEACSLPDDIGTQKSKLPA
jgi:hypothetical protein